MHASSNYSRRALLKRAGLGAVLPFVGLAQAPRDAAILPADASAPGRRLRDAWLAQAEAAKPRLVETAEPPLGLVRPVADRSQYLRWSMPPDADKTPLSERLFRKGDSFILDFGGHRAGHFAFHLAGEGPSVDAPARLQITFGEVPGDVAEPLYPYHGQLSSAWLPVEIITVDFLPQEVRMARRYAFRYVKVEILDTSPNFAVRFSQVTAIGLSSATNQPQPLPSSAPDWLHKVDAVSLRTLHDCMQTTFEDGPRRDQRLWIGDLRLQARASYVTYPNHSLVKRCLLLFAALPRESDGFLPACVFEKPAPSTTETFILDYAALYGAIVLDYARATRDLATARALWPVALRQMKLLQTFVDANGLFQIPRNYWAFIDWSQALDRAASMQGVMLYAYGQLIELARLIGEEIRAREFAEIAGKMRAAARKQYFDPSQGVCVSGPRNQISWASQAWLTLGGALSPSEAAAALRKAVLENERSVRPATPYLYHHVVEAMVSCGLREEALNLIRSYWGLMMEDGADTFWEAFDPKDSSFSPYGDVHINSFCHAWSCTPAWFFRALKLGA
jgi:hypothetical protein